MKASKVSKNFWVSRSFSILVKHLSFSSGEHSLSKLLSSSIAIFSLRAYAGVSPKSFSISRKAGVEAVRKNSKMSIDPALAAA